jgi:pimeloyl-ACP methyl ester carboxylesterase
VEATTPDGQRISYRQVDGERPVLLVHGFASNAGVTWEATGWLRAFEEAGRGAIAVDLRGHGASSKPTDARLYSAEVLALDLLAVADAEGLDVVDVVGYSMGSQVSRQFAVSHPDRVSRLVLGGMGMAEPFQKVGVAALRAALLDQELPSDPLVENFLAGTQDLPEADRAALAACVEGMATTPVSAAPAAPTLVVAGELDPIASGSDLLAESLNADYLSIAGRRHGNTLSARAFKQAVLEFLA